MFFYFPLFLYSPCSSNKYIYILRYELLKKNEFPASTTTASSLHGIGWMSYTISTGVKFGLFHPYFDAFLFYCAAKMRNPSFRILIAAF